jgi:serine/threonine protein kinase/Flp pilus assembly protein TadD
MDMIGRTISHYKILSKLGEGGMGVVYKAEDTKLHRFVALKFLHPDLTRDEEAKARFIHEAQAASALQHNNICTIHEIDETKDGRLFIAMDCYDGETLKEKIAKGPLAMEEALDIACQAATGLSKAHEAGMVHRDIKPANILITRDGPVKIVDFGLAKLSGRTRLTRTGTSAGTVCYMSPEQLRGADVDHRSDIRALGVVLYEMIAGELPFRGDYEQAMSYSIVNESPKPVRSSRTDVPAEVESVIEKTLSKEPEERYQSSNELIDALKALKRRFESSPVDVGVGAVKEGPSIAVLPFTNLSADKENEYFSDGLAEHILEGSVRRAGSRLRVTAQLVKASDGYHLWSQRFDREMTDVFAIQDEISQAIALDQNYALAHAVLCEIDWAGAFWGFLDPREALPRAKSAALKALRLDDTIAEIHSVLGAVLGCGDYDWPGAEREFRRALELNPSSAEVRYYYADWYLMPLGRVEESLTEIRRALELDPLDPFYCTRVGYGLHAMRQFEPAIEQLRRAVDLGPTFWYTYWWLSITCALSGRSDEAIAAAEKAKKLSGDNALALGMLGRAYGLAGRTSEARQLLE